MTRKKIIFIISAIILMIVIGFASINFEVVKKKYMIWFHRSGMISHYNKFGQLDGEIDIFLDGKITRRENFKNGKFDGWTNEYYRSGVVKSSTNYKNNKADGVELEYYPNGKIKSKKTYKDGKSDGIRVRFYSNGNIENKSFCKDNKSEGAEDEYYENGKLKYERNWINNKPYGDFYYYYENEKVKVYHAYDILGDKFYLCRYDQFGQSLNCDGYVFSPHVYSMNKVNDSTEVLKNDSNYKSFTDLYVTVANPPQGSTEIKITINDVVCKNLRFLDNNTVKINNAFLNKGVYNLLIQGKLLDNSEEVTRSSALKLSITKE